MGLDSVEELKQVLHFSHLPGFFGILVNISAAGSYQPLWCLTLAWLV